MVLSARPCLVVVACFAVSLALLPLSGAARAHHVVAELGVAAVVPQTVVAVEAAAASFDFAHQQGRWQTLTPQLEWRLARRLSVFAALPLARVEVDGHESQAGVGDLALAGKVLLLATPHGGLVLSAGLGMEVPTGDEAAGIGAGHLEVNPFLLASSSLLEIGQTTLLVQALVAPRFTLGSDDEHGQGGADHHAHGSLLAPHASRELAGRALVTLAFAVASLRAHLGAGVAGAAVLQDGPPGYLAPLVEGGVSLPSGLRIALGLESVVAGERRFGTRGRFALGWVF